MNLRLYFFIVLLLLCQRFTSAQTVTKIIDSGPDGSKLSIAVLGEGYAAADMDEYKADVDRIIKDGVFQNDYFKDNRRAFNVYRVDLVSPDSGVSQRRPDQPPISRATALQTTFTGDWNNGPYVLASRTSIQIILDTLKDKPRLSPFPNYVIVLLNEKDYGGVTYNNRFIFTTKGTRLGGATDDTGWMLVSHELGHCVIGLYDEYTIPSFGNYSGNTIAQLNCATTLDASTVLWKQFITPGIAIPSVMTGSSADGVIGMFKGCNTYNDYIYRPAPSCRMKDFRSPFCKVCRWLMDEQVSRYLTDAPAEPALTSASAMMTAPAPALIQPAQQQESRLELLVRISEGGELDVITTTEVHGNLKQRAERASDFAYEIRRGTQQVFAEDLPADPFVVRGFPMPDAEMGHSVSRSQTGITTIQIPQAEIEDVLDRKLGIRLYGIKGDPRQPAVDAVIDDINPTTLNQLKQEKRLRKLIDYSPQKLSGEILNYSIVKQR